tara:strand:- start:1018 stop:1152 length:135 start_codon:yes stop_codon:yes gene_type:complete
MDNSKTVEKIETYHIISSAEIIKNAEGLTQKQRDKLLKEVRGEI